jgi:hypothetical protein
LAYLPTGADKTGGDGRFPTLYPEGLEFVPRRFAITRRNRWMVEQSDYVIAYVQTGYGGAYIALEHARQRGVKTVNLAASASSQLDPK